MPNSSPSWLGLTRWSEEWVLCVKIINIIDDFFVVKKIFSIFAAEKIMGFKLRKTHLFQPERLMCIILLLLSIIQKNDYEKTDS
jgi:hypothetical protein